MPLVTVFTSTYNRAYSLPRLYESLIHQTYTDFEWLVIDDGSIDDTKRLVQQWAQEQDNDTVLLSGEWWQAQSNQSWSRAGTW